MKRPIGALLATLAVTSPAQADPVAVLQGLDKITARISTIEAPIEEVVAFGSLQIRARACRKRPPEEPPESAAFLEIVDDRPDSEPVRIFSGWMFASTPALSALEHPVYDVWVLDCGERQALPAGITEAAATGPETETSVPRTAEAEGAAEAPAASNATAAPETSPVVSPAIGPVPGAGTAADPGP